MSTEQRENLDAVPRQSALPAGILSGGGNLGGQFLASEDWAAYRSGGLRGWMNVGVDGASTFARGIDGGEVSRGTCSPQWRGA